MKTAMSPKHLRVLTLLVATPFLPGSSLGAWHDDHRGTAIRAHHVRLSGHGGDNALQRRLLAEEYRACAETNPKLGLPVQALPAGGIPAIISSHEIDVYYAQGRTLTAGTGTRYHLDRDNCAVVAHDHATLKIANGDGTCEVDLIRRQARGLCSAHISASGASGGREVPIDMSKVPEHLREQVSKNIARLRQGRPPGTPAPAVPGTGQSRTIAGLRCDVYANAALPIEICVARPPSPFPIPAAPFNAAVPGLLLDAQSPVLTITAREVTLDMGLSSDAFDLPPDIRILGGNR
jgi:hypothetical protein